VTNSANTVEVSGQAKVEAGVNYQTEIQLLPIFVDGKRTIEASRLGQALNDAEKTKLGLSVAQSYEYAPLILEDVAMGVTTGSIVELVGTAFGKGTAGQYMMFSPGSFQDTNIVLEKEDYTNQARRMVPGTRAQAPRQRWAQPPTLAPRAGSS
jgi:hypothetical protein